MGKTDLSTIALVAVVVLLALMYFDSAETPAALTGNGVDLSVVVEPEVSFTGQRMFRAGTALITEYARVIEHNGDTVRDLGQTRMNGGMLNTVANKNYMIYYGENATPDTYYTDIESYRAPVQDAADNKVGVMCYMDTTPTITVYDEDNDPILTSNAQAIGTDDKQDLTVKIESSSDLCYGNPSLGKQGLKNALCFHYNSTGIRGITAEGLSALPQGTPYIIQTDGNSTQVATVTKCFGFDTLKDGGEQLIKYTVETTNVALSAQENGTSLVIAINDIAFDLDSYTLEPIKNFQDETNTELGYSAAIYKVVYLVTE